MKHQVVDATYWKVQRGHVVHRDSLLKKRIKQKQSYFPTLLSNEGLIKSESRPTTGNNVVDWVFHIVGGCTSRQTSHNATTLLIRHTKYTVFAAYMITEVCLLHTHVSFEHVCLHTLRSLHTLTCASKLTYAYIYVSYKHASHTVCRLSSL